MPVNALGSIKCYSTCPRVSRMNVTWCVHIYHPAEEVNICFNNSGLISLTPLAATLNLHTQFSVCITRGASCQHKLHNSSSFFPPGSIPLRSATLQEIYAPVLLRFTRITPILFARCRPTRAVIERLST